jgi:hypothetical protein
MLGRLTEWLATSAQCEEAPEKVRFPPSQPDFFSFFSSRTRSLFFILGEIFFKARSFVGGRDPSTHKRCIIPFLSLFSFLQSAWRSRRSPLPLFAFVRSFGCVGLLSLQGKKREREKERMVGKKRVCVYFRTFCTSRTHTSRSRHAKGKNHKK